MKLFLIGGMEDLNFNYCYKIIYESGETYDRRRNELSVEISKEDYKKIITGVLQERSIDQIEDYRKMPVNSVNTAFQGVLSNDKSVICLPRQCLMDAVKALILLDFLGINQ